jgi:hypothetical protein
MVRIFDKVVQTIVQRHISEKKKLLNAGQFGVHACHTMRLKDLALNFNNSQSMPAVFLDI